MQIVRLTNPTVKIGVALTITLSASAFRCELTFHFSFSLDYSLRSPASVELLIFAPCAVPVYLMHNLIFLLRSGARGQSSTIARGCLITQDDQLKVPLEKLVPSGSQSRAILCDRRHDSCRRKSPKIPAACTQFPVRGLSRIGRSGRGNRAIPRAAQSTTRNTRGSPGTVRLSESLSLPAATNEIEGRRPRALPEPLP